MPTTDIATQTIRCTHGGDCKAHPDVRGLHDFDPVVRFNPTDVREQTFTAVALAIGDGLPVPMAINISTTGGLDIRVQNDRADAVEQWARHLGLPTPAYGRVFGIEDGFTRPWRAYRAENSDLPMVAVWGSVEFAGGAQ